MTDIADIRIILAAYSTPGVYAIESLFSFGLFPDQIRLLTHKPDQRNATLIEFAKHAGIEFLYSSVNEPETVSWVKDFQPDVIFSLHFRDRIPNALLTIPKLGGVNLHPSLLPDYRGCFSAPWMILNGEQKGGFTYHYMVEQFDKGNIIYQESVEISEADTAFSLFHRLIVRGMQAFDTVIKKVIENHDGGQPMPAGGRYYPRKLPHEGRIDTSWEKDRIDRFIRAMTFPPYPPAQVYHNDKLIDVHSLGDYLRLQKGNK